MPFYAAPGVYVEEVPSGARPIGAVGTSTAAFVGVAPNRQARPGEAVAVNNWTEFCSTFAPQGSGSTVLANAVFGFFNNGGGRCYVVNVDEGAGIAGTGTERSGLALLEAIDEVAIVAAPGYSDAASYDALLSHCELMEDRVAILDPPGEVRKVEALTRAAAAELSEGNPGSPGNPGEPREPGEESPPGTAEAETPAGESAGDAGVPAEREGRPPARTDQPSPRRRDGAGADEDEGLRPRQSDYGTLYFPHIVVRDPLAGQLVSVPPSGHMAGIWARTDMTRGVHKAPANEPVRGALNVTYRVTRQEQELLNPKGVNCIRYFPVEGIRVWGARTLGAEAGEFRYLNVRRLFNMLKESIAEGTRWIVFEPNDYVLWRAIRRDVGAFLTRVWRDGALFGRTPQEAFFVKCDEETNPTEERDAGYVTTLIGVAPVKPAEFVVFKLSQSTAGTEIETVGG